MDQNPPIAIPGHDLNSMYFPKDNKDRSYRSLYIEW